MSNLTIFKDKSAVSTSVGRERTALSQALAQSVSMRRIVTNTNGTFKRLINGEQMGNAIRGEFNCIIVDALPQVSRVYYAGKYDPNAKPTLPDCWSNLGVIPEQTASNKQAAKCADCRQNVKGSGDNGGRACRYERRIAILLEGDPSGEVYQFKIPAKSLFGQGTGNVHPFESYVKFLIANNENPDTVVTNISYDLNADTMELLFTPMRGLTEEEYALVQQVQADPETKRYIQLTVGQVDGVTAKPQAKQIEKQSEETPAQDPTPAVARSEEPDDAPMTEPVKRGAAKQESVLDPAALSNVLNEWGAEDDE